jgi:thiosulfate/3-mercaptopyruvate sulfurtransferase
MMPDPKHFTRVMKAMGVKKSQTLVIYETGGGWFATRAAFMMKAFGHSEVYVLDGGFKKWQSEGRKVISNDESTWEADFDYNLDDQQIYNYAKVKDILADGSVQLIEARPPPAIQASGAIEGAISVPGPACLAEDGTMKSKEALTELFESKGVDISKPMAFSCGTGMLASFVHAAAVKA